MKLSKDILGLAAEFAVASELCKRNIYAQLTLGLRKRTDILIETEIGMLRIQVKGKQGREWPGCKGLYGGEKDIILVFVDFENKAEAERPDFYILTVNDWKELLGRELVSTGKVESGDVTINEENVPTWSDGWKGIGVKPKMIIEHKEQWNKIKKIVERST